VLVLCGTSGVQSQSYTVDRQMRRYNVPRLAFINKLDRAGADPARVTAQLKDKLRHNTITMQLPIGEEADFEGIIDLIKMKAYHFDGDNGEEVREEEIPAELLEKAKAARHDLIAAVADHDDEMAEIFLAEQEPTIEQIRAAIRRATISLKMTPVFIGSAYKNKGVQLLLDGNTIYALRSNTLTKFPKAGGTPTVLASVSGTGTDRYLADTVNASALAVDDQFVYWTYQGHDQILKIAK